MSVDTRTPRTPPGGRSAGYDDEPHLNMAKVPSDPAQVIVNHASFRVRLATPVRSGALAETARLAALAGAGAGLRSRPARRRAPVVWSGRTSPGDGAATQLLQAVRQSEASLAATATTGATSTVRAARAVGAGPSPAHGAPGGPGGDVGATQVLPRVAVEEPPPPGQALVIGPRTPYNDSETPPGGTRYARGRFDGSPDADAFDDGFDTGEHTTVIGPVTGAGHWQGAAAYAGDAAADTEHDDARAARKRRGSDSVRHAYYPGRRMNLGVVLLPLRVFLGFISIYAGMGKLCDPVYFDGGERGSMVIWLQSLHPWAVASPLRDFALEHPVGAGLTIAFSQVVVGVLTVFGLWQRLAASVGALLSAALLVTVSWRTVAAYDAPDIIYLAAWSPLIIAGAPVYSMDARLAGEAWRTLGPRVEVRDLRRRVLRRGSVLAAVITGLTLLIGSMLGGAVRSSDTVRVPGPSEPPTNHLPGKTLPGTSEASTTPGTRSPEGERSSSPSAAEGSSSPAASEPSAERTPGATTGQVPAPGSQPAGPSGPQVRQPQSQVGGGQTSSQTSGAQTAPQVRPEAPQSAPQQQRQAPPPDTDSDGDFGGDDDSTGSGGTSGGSAGTGALGGLLG
ncbi:DoxX family membrane protein [Streptomyces sp. NPDC057702]|uniref:DoxX family protein n=1 Tax=unclassified Streptomyces TaxID=2593676 RepID=UPI0036741C45